MGKSCLSFPLEDSEKRRNNGSGWGKVLVIVYEGISAVFTTRGVYSLNFYLLKQTVNSEV